LYDDLDDECSIGNTFVAILQKRRGLRHQRLRALAGDVH